MVEAKIDLSLLSPDDAESLFFLGDKIATMRSYLKGGTISPVLQNGYYYFIYTSSWQQHFGCDNGT